MPHHTQSIISPLLVGRAAEREYLRQALAAARDGHGSVALLAGEAGVGKSRLAEETRRQATADGFHTLKGHCFEDDVGFAYAPLIDALRAWLAPLPESKVAALLGARAAEIIRLLPELAQIIPDALPPAALDAEAEKRRLMESLYRVLMQSALPPQSTPLLLIAEDLHWSDESSLDFLYLLARRATDLPVVVICTYRHEERQPHLGQWLARMTRERLAHELALQTLSLDEVNHMVRAIVGPELSLPVETIEQIYNLTEGNPFFVEEVLKVLVADGSGSPPNRSWIHTQQGEIQIPKSLQDAIHRRTSQLSAEAHHLLTWAAVAGRRFDFTLLQQIMGHSDLKLMALLKELVAAQLVVEETADHFAFRHALTQQAVYSTLLGRERASLHRTIGMTLERLHTATQEVQAAHLSHHFYAAGEWAKTLDYALRAGTQAQAMYEPRAAVEQWTRALDAADRLDQPNFPARVRALCARGWAFEMLGQFEQARSDHEAALSLARKEGDRPAEWQALLDLGSLWFAQDYTRAGTYLQQALEVAREVEDDEMLAHSFNRVGNWHLNLNQTRAALGCHLEALLIFQRTQDRRGEATTLDLLGMTAHSSGDSMSCVRYYEQALALCEELDDRASMSSIWATLTANGASWVAENTVLPDSTLYEEGIQNQWAVKLAREINWRAGECYALLTLALVHAYHGEYGLGLDLSLKALAIAESIEHREWLALAHLVLGLHYFELLDLILARQQAAISLELAQQAGSSIMSQFAAALLSNVHLALGELEPAKQLLAPILATNSGVYTLTMGHCLLAQARLELALGAPERALRLIDKLIAMTPNIGRAGVQAVPALLLARAEALIAVGREEEAESVLRLAQEGATARHVKPLHWHILARLATLYHSQERHDEMIATADAARRLIAQIADTIPEQELRDSFIARADQRLPQVATHRRARGGDAPARTRSIHRGRAYAARDGSCKTDRRRTLEPGDCRATVDHRAHRHHAHQPHLRQTRL